MPNIQIYQGQNIIFTDTTTGGLLPYEYSWSFSGGVPSTATGPTASVTYSSPGDYTATLTVTDAASVTSSLVQTDLVNVLPAAVFANFSRQYTSRLMDETNSFTDTSTGLPSAPDTFAWTIGSYTATTQNVTGFSYSDWVDVPGALAGDAPGTEINVSVELTASNVSGSDTVVKGYSVYKIGPLEEFVINGYPLPLTSYDEESPVAAIPTRTSSIGLPGNDIIMSITPGTRGSGAQPIQYFHSNLESATIYCTGLPPTISSDFLNSGWGSFSGFACIVTSLYGSVIPTVVSGNYILGGGSVNKIYFSVSSDITALVDSYNYTNSLLAEIIGSRYPILHSAQLATYPSRRFPVLVGAGTFKDPVIPSPQYLQSYGAPVASVYEVTVSYISKTAGAGGFTISFNDNGGVGNVDSGNYYAMQDVGGQSGVASILNAAFTSNFAGGTNDVEAVALQRYNIDTGGTPSSYYGLKILLKTTDIIKLEFADNSKPLDLLISPFGGEVLPFGSDKVNATGHTCTGCMRVLTDLLDYQEIGSQVQIGGSIA